MNLHKQWIRAFCVVSLAVVFAAVPSAWALAPAPGAKSTSATAEPSNTTPIDINRATRSQLMSVPGIGVVYAERIITHRPYRSKYELVTRGILSRNVYNQIKDRIVAHRVRTK